MLQAELKARGYTTFVDAKGLQVSHGPPLASVIASINKDLPGPTLPQLPLANRCGARNIVNVGANVCETRRFQKH